MSLNHSPSVVTNGLVMCYDMNNTKKSWKGQPTTNYVSSATTMAGWNNYSNTANGTPAQFVTEFGTTGYRMDNVGSWNGVYKSVTVPAAGIYTFSAWIKWIAGSDNVTGGAVYISGWGGSDSASATNRTLPNQWQRISITLNCTTTSMTFYLISWGGTNNADNHSWQVTMPQIEAGSYVTPFVEGSRSNTQAIVDLTGNNALTATSLTYASDNTFSFNGSNDKLTLGTNTLISGTSNYTIDAVFKTTNAASVEYIFGNYGPGNSGGLEYYIHQSKLNNYIGGNTQSATTLESNRWYISSVTRNGTTVTHYLNGIADGSASNANSIGTNHPFTVGNGHDYTSEAFGGTIASIKVYNRALSATEVKQNFNALRGRYGV